MTSRCKSPMKCGQRHCVVCVGHLIDLEPQTCVACLGRVRRDLADILALFALLPDQLGHRSGQTALGLMAPGSVGAFWRDAEVVSRLESTPWRPAQRLRHLPVVWSEDPVHQAEQAATIEWIAGSENPHRASDPPSVAFELGQWEDDWRSVRGEPAATEAGTVAGAVGYLSVRAGWAADHHRAFDDFASEVARLRFGLEVATSMDSRPLIGVGVQCFECSVDLRREWTDTGLADNWTCPRCWRAYDQESYWLAVREHLEKSGEGV